MKIIVEKRSNDYQAYIEGKPEYWGCGYTQNEAIGELIKTWYEKFDITIEEINPHSYI